MKSKVTKVIIPVAGFGTRFLPVTKALPKEMLPIVDKPVLQYVVEEAVASGVTDVIIVTNQTKRAAEDHFDVNAELENWLKVTGKSRELKDVQKIASLARFVYIRQKGPYGNGTPVLNARHLIGDEPFAVIWGDDIFTSTPPRLHQLMEVYERYTDPVLTACEVSAEDTKRYGMIEGVRIERDVYQVKAVREKPGPKTKSRLASLGGYILTPDIFPILERTKLGKSGELWLVDAILALAQRRPVYACVVKGTYYDVGSKLGWLKANVDFALQRLELAQPLRAWLKNNLYSSPSRLNVKSKTQNPK